MPDRFGTRIIRSRPLTEHDQFADRVEQITKSLYGSVLSADGDTMLIEVPADLFGAAMFMLGGSGLQGILKGQQRTRLAPVRTVDANGKTVVHDEQRTMAFFPIEVNLTPHHVAVDHTGRGHAAAITAPTKPFTP